MSGESSSPYLMVFDHNVAFFFSNFPWSCVELIVGVLEFVTTIGQIAKEFLIFKLIGFSYHPKSQLVLGRDCSKRGVLSFGH